MNIKIEIECDTIIQIHQHLRVIGMQIRKKRKQMKLDQFEDKFPVKLNIEDSNCYGEHHVKIRP